MILTTLLYNRKLIFSKIFFDLYLKHAALYRAEFNLFKTPCKFYSSDPRKDQVYISPGLFELLKSKQSQLDNLSRKEFTKLEVVHKAKSSQSFESLPGLLASSTTTRRLGFVYRPALATYDHVMELLADLPLISPTCTDNGKYFTLEEVSIQKRHISVQWNVLNILGEIEHHFLPILELYKDKLDIKKEFLYCRLEGLFSRYQELFKELEIIVECFDADTKAYSKSYLTEEKLNHLHVLRSWINIFRKSLFQLLDSLSPLFYHHHHLHNVNVNILNFSTFINNLLLSLISRSLWTKRCLKSSCGIL